MPRRRDLEHTQDTDATFVARARLSAQPSTDM